MRTGNFLIGIAGITGNTTHFRICEIGGKLANHVRPVQNVRVAEQYQFASGALVSITNSAVSSRQESYLRLDFSRATVELTTLYGYTNANWRFSLPPDARTRASS